MAVAPPRPSACIHGLSYGLKLSSVSVNCSDPQLLIPIPRGLEQSAARFAISVIIFSGPANPKIVTSQGGAVSQQKTVMRAGTAREVNAKVPAKQALMPTLLKWTAGVLTIAMLLCGADVRAQVSESQPAAPCDASEVRPPVTKADLEIAKRAKQILDSPAKWNRADTRKCPAEAKTFSLYCALEKATDEVSGKFEHRGAAMQEARFVIDAVAPNRNNYNHRLMDYNNDPATTFADIQKVFRMLEKRIVERLSEEPQNNKK
jgi:hypothetical protein